MPESPRLLRRPSAALTLLLLINLMNYVDRQLLAAVEKPMGDQFGIGPDKTGRLVPAFMVGYIIFSPLFGFLADRMRRWAIVGVGVIVWSLASGGSGWVGTFTALLLMRMLVGIGEAAYGPVAPTIISDLYPIDARGKILAWFYAAIPVGSALGYIIGGSMQRNWHAAFYLTLPPGLLLGGICLFMPEAKRVAGAKRHASFSDYLLLLKNRSYVLDCLGMTAMTFALGGMGFFMPRYLEQVAGLKPEHSTPMFGAVAAVAGLLATIAGGIVGDRLRVRFTGSYFMVSGAGLILGAPLTVLMLFTPFPYCWVVIFIAIFCLFFNTGPTNAIIANVTTPAVRATAFAMNILIIHILGDALSPPTIGWVAARYGLRQAFGAMSVMMLIGAVFWLLGARFLEGDTIAAQSAEVLLDTGVA